MDKILRDTYVEVDLDALRFNMKSISALCGSEVSVMPVIKANGYGHGAAGIAPVLMESGAAYLAVATLTEALELREAYADYPLFILGHTPDRLLDIVIEKNITQTVFSLRQAELMDSLAAKAGKKAKVHLKVDTGFHRLGIYDEEELFKICSLPHIEAEGIFSHLALVNDEENRKQYDMFTDMISRLEARGITFRYKHISDSISLVDYPEYRMNMVRPGALVFGLRGFHKGFVEVKQTLRFVTHISQIHSVKKGEGVGYDYLWKAPEDTVIGTVPFGYADGYPRNMRGKGYVTVSGIKCPVIGVICMDQCMIDLSNVPDPHEGDMAVIYGDGSGNTMDIAEASQLADTNKNEIVSRITARPPRIYTDSRGDLVRLLDLDSDFIIDLKYASSDNFTKQVIYSSKECYINKNTAKLLIEAKNRFKADGYRVKIWDAYRPVSAQRRFWEVMPNPDFVAPPPEINANKALRASHLNGLCVDITLTDSDGRELKMPSAFDEFGKSASLSCPGISDEARKNASYMKKIMESVGFEAYDMEWWHFYDRKTPPVPFIDYQIWDFI